jgi:type II secretory pathway pseudopilin PulG
MPTYRGMQGSRANRARHEGASPAREASPESGELLVELLVTVAILGIGMVAVLGTIWTSLRVSDYHRKTVNADVVVRNYAEAMQQTSGTYVYIPCATLTGSTAYPAYTPPAPNASYVTSVTKIEYLTGYTASNQPTWQDSTAGCPSGGDKGAQRLTLQASSPPSESNLTGREVITLIKRDARGEQ